MAPEKKIKVMTCSDLHGRHEHAYNAFQKFVLDGSYDYLIFMGDYVDSHDRSDEDMYSTVKAVLEFKKECPDQVILLLGNHDAQYMYGSEYRCSGFRERTYPNLNFLFNENRSNFQIAHQIKNFLFTHAGVQDLWWRKYKSVLANYAKLLDRDVNDIDGVADILNAVNQSADRWILFEVGMARGGFRQDYGGPTWCDKSEILFYGPLEGFHHVVGHTQVPFIYKERNFNERHHENTSVTFTDILGKREQFYEVII